MEDAKDKIGDVPQEHVMNVNNDQELSAKENRIIKLLKKVMNGRPMHSETAFRKLTEDARNFGAKPLFAIIFPFLMEQNLEVRQRYRLVKVFNCILHKLDKKLVKPYVDHILKVIDPLLNDEEDYDVHLEGRAIISKLSEVVGWEIMIPAMMPHVYNTDDSVRRNTAKAFGYMACALGVAGLLPFLQMVCQHQEPWHAQYTGIKVVQEIANLCGCSVLDNLQLFVEIIKHALKHENDKLKTMAALCLASLAKAAPSGIDSFNNVLKPLWEGITHHSGKVLASFLKAIGFIIPLMEALDANDYINKVMPILIREFQSPDQGLKNIVLMVVKQCVSTDGVEPDYITKNVVPVFVENFWDMEIMALDKRNYTLSVKISIEIANKVGVKNIANRIMKNLTDNSEYRRQLAMKAIQKVVSRFKGYDIDLEVLIDGILHAFNQQTIDSDVVTMLNGFGTIVTSLGISVKSYFPRICDTLQQRLNNQNEKVRKQSADLISSIVIVMGAMDQVHQLCTLIFNRLEQEHAEVQDSYLEALNSIITVIGVTDLNIPIKDLVASLTRLLDNMSYKVKEVSINLLGMVAGHDRSQSVSKDLWSEALFKIPEKFVERKKVIRVAALNTFRAILKVEAVSPAIIIGILIDKLVATDNRVRMSSTVAIAVVAENPLHLPLIFYTLISKYSESGYRMKRAVLQSLAFIFEYLGNLDKAYFSAVTPLLEHALNDTNEVQRFLAVFKHMTHRAVGLGVEDLLIHLLGHVWPNILNMDSPIVIKAVMEVIDAMRKALGSTVILQFCVQGLFHPARRVREAYWMIYNSLYVADPDALVPAYPSFTYGVGGQELHTVRQELQMFI